ncbi:MAG: hypothetical protein DRH43_05045 [Deltaproteobacteria bacterium]|nr:MAG: hypothetical protein DRH50_07930 [Deltaproteobacteria bacterium]RLC11044.1 MAG: hypothetical protein DRH43_05045 [Deltaproteobacteria bacterium]
MGGVSMRVRVILWASLVLLMSVGFAKSAQTKEAVPIVYVKSPVYDFHQVNQGDLIKHEFRVLNRGTAPLEIKSIRPD